MSSVIIKSDSLFYYKVRWSVIKKCDNFITKCDSYYKVRRLLRSATEQRESFWNLESVSIQPVEIRGEGTDFLHDYREFSITLIERGYITKLPSKTDHPPLPSNSTSLKEEHVQWSSILQETLRMWKCTVTLSLNRRNGSSQKEWHTPKPLWVPATISHTMPCLRNLQPPQYASCKTTAVDNPKNTLALMTVCYQGHLFLMT